MHHVVLCFFVFLTSFRYASLREKYEKAKEINPKNTNYNFQIISTESAINESAKIRQEREIMNKKIEVLEREYNKKKND